MSTPSNTAVKTELRKREKSNAWFVPPPPMVTLYNGWSIPILLPLDEAKELHTKLGVAIKEAEEFQEGLINATK